MSKLIAFAIYDQAAGAYLRPFFLNTVAQSRRSFLDVCSDAKHPIAQHPEDYTLTRIGQFDETTGELMPERHEVIVTGTVALGELRTVDKRQREMLDEQIPPKVNGPLSMLDRDDG